MKPISVRVAANLRALMGLKKQSTSELAEVLGISWKAARQRYNGVQPLSLVELELVSEWLGCAAADLLGDTITQATGVTA